MDLTNAAQTPDFTGEEKNEVLNICRTKSSSAAEVDVLNEHKQHKEATSMSAAFHGTLLSYLSRIPVNESGKTTVNKGLILRKISASTLLFVILSTIAVVGMKTQREERNKKDCC